MALTDVQVQASSVALANIVDMQSDYSSGNLVIIINLNNGQTLTLTFLNRDDLDAFHQALWQERT